MKIIFNVNEIYKQQPKKMKEIAGVNSDTFTILIVDDIALNLLLLDKMLKPFDFQIVKAANGREALETIQSRIGTPGSIDLAIVDLMMPDIDVFKVIEHVRNGCDNAEFRIRRQPVHHEAYRDDAALQHHRRGTDEEGRSNEVA